MLRSCKPALLIGLDASVKQLKTAKHNLTPFGFANLQLVRAAFESLPFRDRIFDAIITCYALRDSLDISRAVSEYGRICSDSGVFADVDLGKPNNKLKRAGSLFYIRYVMPLVAKVVIIGSMRGNPWRMIVPTYDALPTNSVLLMKVRRHFTRVEIKEFLMGGLIVMLGKKS